MTKEQKKEFTLRVTQANHSGLILILCDIVKVYVNDAMEAYKDSDEAEYLRNIELAKRAQNELIACFNPDDRQGREVIMVLRFIYRCLVSSSVKRKPVNIEKCMEFLDKLMTGFVHLHEIDTDEPVMKNVHQVYAGLTYGKGMLNEDTLVGDYSKRGYKV